MIDLQNYLHHRNLYHAAMKKTKSYCCTRNLLKSDSKNAKEK